jgi:hypothetical protein
LELLSVELSMYLKSMELLSVELSVTTCFPFSVAVGARRGLASAVRWAAKGIPLGAVASAGMMYCPSVELSPVELPLVEGEARSVCRSGPPRHDLGDGLRQSDQSTSDGPAQNASGTRHRGSWRWACR